MIMVMGVKGILEYFEIYYLNFRLSEYRWTYLWSKTTKMTAIKRNMNYYTKYHWRHYRNIKRDSWLDETWCLHKRFKCFFCFIFCHNLPCLYESILRSSIKQIHFFNVQTEELVINTFWVWFVWKYASLKNTADLRGNFWTKDAPLWVH